MCSLDYLRAVSPQHTTRITKDSRSGALSWLVIRIRRGWGRGPIIHTAERTAQESRPDTLLRFRSSIPRNNPGGGSLADAFSLGRIRVAFVQPAIWKLCRPKDFRQHRVICSGTGRGFIPGSRHRNWNLATWFQVENGRRKQPVPGPCFGGAQTGHFGDCGLPNSSWRCRQQGRTAWTWWVARILSGEFPPSADGLERSQYPFCPRPGFQKRLGQMSRMPSAGFSTQAQTSPNSSPNCAP
jgi:hypothetical protein